MNNDLEKNKAKLSEKIALKFRKKWLVDGTKTFLIIAILFMAYIALNLWADQADLPNFDVTENKIYTLSDTSKEAIKNITQDVKIYAYGFDEKSTLIDLLKQYNEANEKITYEILTEESNYEMVTKYELSDGYYALIIQAGDSEKVIDASTEFSTYDYVTYQTIDTTEQVITHSILALNEENKPKIYFTTGHGEYDSESTAYFLSHLTNEAYEHDTLNLATTGTIPSDCDILAIMSPTSDLLNTESAAIIDYINKGGEIYFSMDVVSEEVTFPNLQTVLDQYGVTVQNGYVFECDPNQYLSGYPYIFMPQVSSAHEITKDIYTDSVMWLTYAGGLQFKTDDELTNLGVTKETLLSTSETALFISDLTVDLQSAVSLATETAFTTTIDVAAAVTKNVSTGTETTEGTDSESKLVIIACGNIVSDYVVSELNQSYPLSYLGSNLDFAINSMSYLAGKENFVSIRKEYNSSTYTPTNMENLVVISIIIFVPLLIIIVGLIVGAWRKRRK